MNKYDDYPETNKGCADEEIEEDETQGKWIVKMERWGRFSCGRIICREDEEKKMGVHFQDNRLGKAFFFPGPDITQEEKTYYLDSGRRHGLDIWETSKEKFQKFLDGSNNLDPIFLAAVDCLLKMHPIKRGKG